MKQFRFVTLCLVFALFTLNLIAQDDRGVITGTISDPSQADMPGVHVELNSNTIGFHREVLTNDAGVYVFPGLLVGNYELSIRKEGFRIEHYEAITLAVGQTRTINAQMQLATSQTEVRVEAVAPPIDSDSAKVGGVIGSAQVANLALNGRAWTALMALVPGAIDSGGGTQKSIRFAGRGIDDNNYRFDGVDATGINAQSPSANYRLQISTEAIAEFKVDTALYGAETGGSSGGQMEVISKSGSNAFHGTAFEYIRNNVISSRGPFDPSTLPPLRLNQFGGSVGGPIVKNRTFFFLNYEGLEQRAHSTQTGLVPSDAFRAAVLVQSPALAPILNAYPVGNLASSANVSKYVNTATVSSGEKSGLVRIDERISDATSLFARYNIDAAALVSPGSKLLDKNTTDATPLNGSLSLSHVFSPSMFNTVQLGVNRIHAVSGTATNFFAAAGNVFAVTIPGLTRIPENRTSTRSPTSYSLKDDFTWTRGAHTIKAGVEIKRVMYNYNTAHENEYFFGSLTSFGANKVDQINLIGGVPMHGLDKTMDFGYVQDSWKARPNFTLNVGLRYEFFNRFHEIYGRDLPFDLKTCGGFCPVGSEFTFPVTTNLEPRVSFAWAPEMLHGRTSIRSGFGEYKGEGQLGDLNAPNDNYTSRSSLSSTSFSGLTFPGTNFFSLAGSSGVTPRGLIRDRRDPTVLQWGLQVQTTLPGSFVLETGYVGYHAYHQFARTSVNLIDPATGLRPLAAFGPIDVKGADDNSHFHALQTALRRSFKSGLSFAANYMWSHGINDGSTGGGEADYAQNAQCRRCDVASADFDVRHVFSANSVFELPFGKGRRYMNRGGIGDFLLGGRRLTGIAAARSGNPVNVTLIRSALVLPDGNAIQNGTSFTRPNYVSGVSIVPANQNINNWINPAAFSAPANGTWGNLGRNIARGPKFWQTDLGLSKNFPIVERYIVEFRAEAFNAFNRAQFGDPDGEFSDSTFGKITSTVNSGATGSGTPRQFQFAMRLHF